MIIQLINKIKKLFYLECPSCGGRMDVAFIDMEINKMVYKCRNCGKEWV